MSPIWRKAAIRVVFLACLCAVIGVLAERLAYQDTVQRVRSEVFEDINTLRVDLERALSSGVQRVRGLVAYVRGNPDVDQAEFAKVAKYLISDGTNLILDIALARDLVISHVYPEAGNKEALGLDYRENAEQWLMVEKAIQENRITIAGPLELVQGGTGVIARFPVFLPRDAGAPPELWGIASMVVDFDRLLEAIGLDDYRQRYDLVISGRNGQGRAGDPFLGDPGALAPSPIGVEVQLASGSWFIEASPRDGWPAHSLHLWEIVGGTAAIFAIGIGLILWNIRFERALVDSAALLDRARREAVAARQAAEDANHAKTVFLANMSHELRTPLNAIIGFAEVMSRGAFGRIENPKYREYVGDIYQSSRHLLDLISEILDVSRIEHGDVELHESDTDIARVTDSAVQLVHQRMDEKNISFQVDIRSDLPRVWADEVMLRQVLVNIVGNAVKYTPNGGQISVSAGQEHDGAVSIRVADDGPGIDPDLVDMALEPFTQLQRSHGVAHEGTGLGLAIAKRLMEAHGGRLSIDSAPGRGTTVVLQFPAERTIASRAA